MLNSKRSFLWLVMGLSVLIAAGLIFVLVVGSGSETHIAPVVPENTDWKSFQSAQYQYSFVYPSSLIGGTQILDSGSPTLESVVFQTPSTAATSRIAIFSSVEKLPSDLKGGLADAALQYEKGLTDAHISFTQESVSTISIDGVEALEKRYQIAQSHATTRFALRNSKLYIFSILRPTDDASAAVEKKILDSFHF
jgi:hypothetical protein